MLSMPEMWNFDSLLQQIRHETSGSKARHSSILTAYLFHRRLSSGLRACSNSTSYA